MRAELKRLREENKSLNDRVIALTEKLSNTKTEAVGVKSEVSEDEPLSAEGKSDESSSEDDGSNSSSSQRSSHVKTS